MHRQNEMRRMHIGRRASPMWLKHMQASPPNAFNALIVFHKPLNSQHSTFESQYFPPTEIAQKLQPEEKGGIVSTMISGIRYLMG